MKSFKAPKKKRQGQRILFSWPRTQPFEGPPGGAHLLSGAPDGRATCRRPLKPQTLTRGGRGGHAGSLRSPPPGTPCGKARRLPADWRRKADLNSESNLSLKYLNVWRGFYTFPPRGSLQLLPSEVWKTVSEAAVFLGGRVRFLLGDSRSEQELLLDCPSYSK